MYLIKIPCPCGGEYVFQSNQNYTFYYLCHSCQSKTESYKSPVRAYESILTKLEGAKNNI